MSKVVLDEEVARFFDADRPQVLCVKGKWGVGKTFAWKRSVLERAKTDDGMPPYAYVSLFGINSLTSLKFSIFERTMARSQVGDGPSERSFKTQLDKLKGWGRTISSFATNAVGTITGADASELVAQSAFVLVQNQIVCIDDLERKGKDLDLGDVLGLVSYLKEERGCRIVLLLNDQQLAGEDAEAFVKNLEKVVDTTITFSPTPIEACAIAFSQPDALQSEIVNSAVILGITNIRVLVKIERQARQAWNILEDYGIDVQKLSTKAVVVAGWSTMQPDEAPSMKFLESFNHISILMHDRADAMSDGEKKWSGILRELEFGSADEFDRMLFEGVKTGRFDAEAIRAQATETMQQFVGKNASRFERAWDRYHNSFDVDDAAVAAEISAGAVENITTTSLGNINATVSFLKKFGYNAEAKAVIDALPKHFEQSPDIIDKSGMFFDPIDPEISETLDRMRREYVDPRDPKDVLTSAVENSSWGRSDLRLLSRQNTDYYETLFVQTEGRMAHALVETAISMSQERSPEGAAMRAAVRAALERISALSPMSETKVRGYLESLGQG